MARYGHKYKEEAHYQQEGWIMKQRNEADLVWKDRLKQKWRELLFLLQEAYMSFSKPPSLHLQEDHSNPSFAVTMILSWLMENYSSKGITSSCGCTDHICNTQHKNSFSVAKGHQLGTNPGL